MTQFSTTLSRRHPPSCRWATRSVTDDTQICYIKSDRGPHLVVEPLVADLTVNRIPSRSQKDWTLDSENFKLLHREVVTRPNGTEALKRHGRLQEETHESSIQPLRNTLGYSNGSPRRWGAGISNVFSSFDTSNCVTQLPSL